MAATIEWKTKGSHLIQARGWIDEALGEGAFRKLVDEIAAPISPVLLPGTWYDVEGLVRVLATAALKLGRSVEDITAEIARRNALADLTTIYRIFLRIAAPARVLGQAPRLWSTYVAFGDARAVVNEPGHFIGEGSGIPTHLLDWTCGAWRGFLPAAVELAGGKSAIGKIVSRDTGADGLARLRYELNYR